MATVTKMRLAFEAAVQSVNTNRRVTNSPLKARVVRSLKKRVGVKFNKNKS